MANTMGLFSKGLKAALSLRTQIQVAPLRKSAAIADELMEMIRPIVVTLHEIAEPKLAIEVSEWSLENRTLMTFLGYLAGIVTTAEFARTKSNSQNGIPPREIAFFRLVNIFFGELPNTKLWAKCSEVQVNQNTNPQQIDSLLGYSSDFRVAFESSSEFYGSLLSSSKDTGAGALLILRLEMLLREVSGDGPLS